MTSKKFYRICFNGPGHILYGGGYERTDMIAFDVNNGAMLKGFPKVMPGYILSLAAHNGMIAAASKGLRIHYENEQFQVIGETRLRTTLIRRRIQTTGAGWLPAGVEAM